MTLWLRDCSDYDPDPISFGGLAGVTHKATEGTMAHSKAEGMKLAARLNAARAAGVPVLGAYHVLRTPGNGGAGSLAQQLTWWVARLDDQVPWWRTWPHWVMQIDAEKWSYDQVSPNTVLQFAALLRGSGLPGWKVTYASRGQYSNTLTGLATPLWNADYRTGNGSYPGDTATAADKGAVAYWAPYSGQTPALLQFAGGPDMSAYRGSLADLLNLTGDDVAFLDDPNAAAVAWRLDALTKGLVTVAGGPTKGETMWVVKALIDQKAADAADAVRDQGMQAALDAIKAGGTSVDTAAVVTAVNAVATSVEQLHQENAALKAELAGYQAREAQAAQAEADALKA